MLTRGWKRWSTLEHCLPGRTCLLYSGAYRSCEYLYKTHTHTETEQFSHGKGVSQEAPPLLRVCRQLMTAGGGRDISLGVADPGKLAMLLEKPSPVFL